MAEDIMGGLSDAFGGLVPDADLETQIADVQEEISGLRKQEETLYIEIGRQAFEANPYAYSQAESLRSLRTTIADAEAKLALLQQEQAESLRAAEEARRAAEEAAEAERKAREAAAAAEKLRCSNCGRQNPEGMKFCPECGTKLGVPPKVFCTNCGQEIGVGVRFCGECGAKQE